MSTTSSFDVTIGGASQPARMLELARSIRSPWYRCQGLCIAACHFKGPQARAEIIDEALEVASRAGDAIRVVTASAWPVRVLAIDGRFDRLDAEIDRLLPLTETATDPVLRAEGLRQLLDSVMLGRRDTALRVIAAFVAACVEPLPHGRRNERGQSLLADCLPALARIDERVARDALSRLPERPLTSAFERYLSMRTRGDDLLAAWERLSVY